VYYFQFYIWETFIPFLRSGARRINWTHAIQAPGADGYCEAASCKIIGQHQSVHERDVHAGRTGSSI